MSIDKKEKEGMYDEASAASPFRYIMIWVLPQENLDNLTATGAGATPDIICARRVLADPTLDPKSFDRKEHSLLFFKIGVCKDIGCHEKIT